MTDVGADGGVGLLAALVESSDDSILSVDLEGRITSCNSAAEATFGYAPGALVGEHLGVLDDPDSSDTTEQLRRIGRGERILPFESLRRRRDGTVFPVSMTMSPVRDPSGLVVGAATISRDISDRVAIELHLAALRAGLEHRNMLLARSNADLERFAAVASHDLLEPLRAVSGMVQLLARRYEGRLDLDADEFIAFATDGCERMRVLIDDLLAYSLFAAEEPVPVPVDLGGVFVDVVHSLQVVIDETGADVSAEELPTLNGVRHELVQVFENLMSNAVKFHQPAEAPAVRVSARRAHDAWIISFDDNGPGVPPEHRERVFDVFRRLHSRDEHSGTGIGLAICRRVVERHGGRIWIDDAPGSGARFSFSIPDRFPDRIAELVSTLPVSGPGGRP